MREREKAISLLDGHSTLALATRRPDGSPQASILFYDNRDLSVALLLSRTSEEYQNICADWRVSVAVGSHSVDPRQIERLSIRGRAWEIRDEPYRSQICGRIAKRHPAYFEVGNIDYASSAVVRVHPDIVCVSDFAKGLGHVDTFIIGADDSAELALPRADNWGPNPAVA